MKKVLIVETNVAHYGGTTDPTGLWLGEAAEFVDEMQRANIAVDYVSPHGGFVPLDPRSMKYTDEAIMAIYENSDFIERALTNTYRPDQIVPTDYSAIYYTGGHGVMWDFPDNAELQAITRTIYANGGYVTSVCHGIAGLLNVKDQTNHYLIKDKKITGFTATEEVIAGKKRVVPFLNQQAATAHGAHFKKRRFYREYAVRDGQLITGQNPFSVRAVAKQLVSALA
ncbi:type 1 glutamine amidotransferase domain-containing protein [Lactiplantibacillus herbarum]|uniref:type 1 glutamine amidotransferase domain-containing protein n=1 Tax=Lactiplantibacillus herbarum TaxID=1670446 RepID=UPI00064E8472|nr:type 1 glutamine amidotransferase domain-containing protein [Lactiplantibacillus herbarum]